jgi:MOSC domain-containing protein YiiM
MEPRPVLEAIRDKGFSGDAAFGTSRRQVLLVDAETLDQFALSPGAVRENITTSGVSFPELAPGARLQVGDAVLEITADCTPCDYLDRLRPGLRQEIAGRRGVLARVERGGIIEVGSAIQVLTGPDGDTDD